ncbi:unnamed protein product [Lactuca saligna]|uniref:Uncharacterized protein n=1 Tax=Lactuca saligna TaxID=75948 RepID=A0AA36EIV8_LACSI|nr:unnamed protein product [Lactuca saligna]
MTKRVANGSIVKLENLMWTDKMDNVLVEVPIDEHEIGQIDAIAFKTKKLKRRKLKDEDEVVAGPQPESFEHGIMHTFKEIVDVRKKSHDCTCEEIEKELESMGLDDNEFADGFIYLSHNQGDARTIFSFQ